MNIVDMVKNPETVIIDVRTPEEFAEGNVPNSKNIPLNEVLERIQEFKDISNQIVVCCRSGGRSGMAEMMLKQSGITNIANGGGWTDVMNMINS